jgi:hypothetical protein
MAGLLGLGMAITLTKFGNPIIFKSLETPPANFWEALLANWPTSWSFFVGAALALCSLAIGVQRASLVPLAVTGPLAVWIFWVGLSVTHSVDRDLSNLTLLHFGVTALVFFLGVTCLPSLANAQLVFKIMIFALIFALWNGLDQHYGGLEAMRKTFYETPGWEKAPAEMKLKVASERIFGPFVYPNTFAGALLIWAPVLTLALWDWTRRLPSIIRKVLVGLFAYSAVACFFWTGSKAGWLIAIAMCVVALLHLDLKRTTKIIIIAAVLALGLAGFAFKNRSYFEKGATSAGARVVYWKAAIRIANEHPLLGAGPGTFAKTFAPIKPPDAEMARLVHNDYLEQACDSGWPAFALFAALIAGAMYFAHSSVTQSPYHFCAWLGLVGWSLQSFVEFGLYIPAISWSAFLLLGWLIGSRIAIDTPRPAR